MTELKCYRGHIRNWKELCEELEINTILPREEREPMILAKGYQAWGKALPDHLYGMFAFALWDDEEESLYCARDHFGTKPFYYYETEEGGLLYGTMIRDIMEKPGFVKELNEKMLQIYLSLTYVAGEDTFFKGLKKLMPGHFLIWKGGELTIDSSAAKGIKAGVSLKHQELPAVPADPWDLTLDYLIDKDGIHAVCSGGIPWLKRNP